jgi:hypothetical protein
MWKLKPSPRTIKATEKYIFSLGRKREELTEEQWNLMVHYVQGLRFAIPILLFLELFSVFFAFEYCRLGQKFTNDALFSQSAVVKMMFKDPSKSISLSQEDVPILNHAREYFILAGMNIMLVINFFILIIFSLTLTRQQNKKTHRILLSRPTEIVP